MGKNVLSGDLAFLNLAEVLQVVANCSATGQLVLHSKYLEGSASIFVTDGTVIDAECGEKKGEEAVLALFGWIEGAFEFIEKPVTRDKRIRTSPMKLIMEASHKLDEGKIEKVGAVSHEKGAAVVVIRPRPEAQNLCKVANNRSRGDGYPLTFSTEPDK